MSENWPVKLALPPTLRIDRPPTTEPPVKAPDFTSKSTRFGASAKTSTGLASARRSPMVSVCAVTSSLPPTPASAGSPNGVAGQGLSPSPVGSGAKPSPSAAIQPRSTASTSSAPSKRSVLPAPSVSLSLPPTRRPASAPFDQSRSAARPRMARSPKILAGMPASAPGIRRPAICINGPMSEESSATVPLNFGGRSAARIRLPSPVSVRPAKLPSAAVAMPVAGTPAAVKATWAPPVIATGWTGRPVWRAMPMASWDLSEAESFTSLVRHAAGTPARSIVASTLVSAASPMIWTVVAETDAVAPELMTAEIDAGESDGAARLNQRAKVVSGAIRSTIRARPASVEALSCASRRPRGSVSTSSIRPRVTLIAAPPMSLMSMPLTVRSPSSKPASTSTSRMVMSRMASSSATKRMA